MYFSLVAIPPRMCRSALFFCNTVFTLCARFGEIIDSRFVTSICTVDLLMPNTAAVCLTVELFLTIYSPSSIHLFSTISFIKITIAFQATNQILSTATGEFEQRISYTAPFVIYMNSLHFLLLNFLSTVCTINNPVP